MLDINNISYKSDKTWKLIDSGHTCGVFQLESNLGSSSSKKVKPKNISQLSALISLMRPGGLSTGFLDKYADIINNKEEVESFNDNDIDRILNPTHNLLLYQEQLLLFATEIAFKDLPENDRLVLADKLRKGVGKKDANLLQSLKEQFINGCLKNGKSQEISNKLWDLIYSQARYSFNASHAFKYASWTYRTAYLKSLYPYEFYTVYLTYSKLKQKPREEIRKLINEAKMLNINILPPCISEKNGEFKIINKNGKKNIIYGLDHIKQVGASDLNLIKSEKIDNWQKLFKLHFDDTRKSKLRSPAVKSLISCGACDIFNIQRSLLVEIFNILESLTKRELTYILEHLDKTDIKNIPDLLINCANEICTKNRKDLLISEASVLITDKKDTYTWRASMEKDLLGIAMTCSPVDDKKDAFKEMTCQECYKKLNNNKKEGGIVAVILDNINKLVTKNGKNPGSEMAQLNISDKTGQIRVACFPEEYEKFKDILFEHLPYQITLNGTGTGWCVKNIISL